jgi:hypothetical protein
VGGGSICFWSPPPCRVKYRVVLGLFTLNETSKQISVRRSRLCEPSALSCVSSSRQRASLSENYSGVAVARQFADYRSKGTGANCPVCRTASSTQPECQLSLRCLLVESRSFLLDSTALGSRCKVRLFHRTLKPGVMVNRLDPSFSGRHR